MVTPNNVLYYGDDLDVLRRHVADASVDLVYLDPPFKSSQNYNVLFAEQDGSRAAAQNNFARPHHTVTKARRGIHTMPAMAAGVRDHVRKPDEITRLADETPAQEG